ncbi:MAG: hypothetical protein LUC44_00240 [Prevotellaceae bacterium]|nr:hypothetical protein [Prevotellaceae bacterium]
MKEEDIKKLIGLCRYYNGEEENPYRAKDKKELDDDTQNKAMLWFYERGWVNMFVQGRLLQDYTDEYIVAGLGDFSRGDGIPTSLKALLFNRYRKCDGGTIWESAESFKEFYKRYYP